MREEANTKPDDPGKGHKIPGYFPTQTTNPHEKNKYIVGRIYTKKKKGKNEAEYAKDKNGKETNDHINKIIRYKKNE
ncbi:hypothetical protein Fleli_3630 [Bernardetia litoralis DSM 6794]|uniref:Uncharacterized protein n=2 Tax=Bernardetia litoralis TaxID=999 RepID=I4APR2_BERLS|nr:hypothetical protein Fleli_3630 [Bernardetia litoralis DSM 6794]